jgi:DNA-binding NtrC family response regulator
LKRILVADDDPAILDGLSTLLARDYEVVAARNGEDLLIELERRPFDLVLLDLRMPLIQGENVLTAIHAEGRSMPVIVMSGNRRRIEEALRRGAHESLAKPFAFRELEEKIERLIGTPDRDRTGDSGRPQGPPLPTS